MMTAARASRNPRQANKYGNCAWARNRKKKKQSQPTACSARRYGTGWRRTWRARVPRRRASRPRPSPTTWPTSTPGPLAPGPTLTRWDFITLDYTFFVSSSLYLNPLYFLAGSFGELVHIRELLEFGSVCPHTRVILIVLQWLCAVFKVGLALCQRFRSPVY